MRLEAIFKPFGNTRPSQVMERNTAHFRPAAHIPEGLGYLVVRAQPHVIAQSAVVAGRHHTVITRRR